jgi:maltose-binding protein MalE
MDVTTQQITRTNWSSNLSKWIIRDAVIYGYEVLTPPSGSGSNVLLQIFDERIGGIVVSGLNIEEFKCFNVKGDDIYVVSSHVMQWDKRYLANPVRTSTDPIYVNKSKVSFIVVHKTVLSIIYVYPL